ncbi:hypothetical protein FDP41_007897 [Naegleria fowleri]|uniref:Uncharacterized protein n=1 Tax=Naegleria fowleri TaxID=5763 RepID=A0A6A5CAG6_NAEFO|nr:uncharacterized protein FDP41_007897 [Naegleria fowleri]KAF0983982.1 hypothetical protein FDP41_007897 [Naegleria fowleri]CAG4709316.1 unnamed protein product [Naegleria fowleri]
MRFLVFASSLYLYLLAAFGCLISWMYLVNEEPWLIDEKSNREILGVTSDISMDHYFESLRSSLSSSSHVGQSIKALLRAHYQFSCLVFLLSSVLILLIVFFATRNRMLTLLTHMALGVWLIAFGFVMKPMNAGGSYHAKIYWVAVASNIVGTILYILHLTTSSSKKRNQTTPTITPTTPTTDKKTE